ncbi:MAG: nuclear transport factor 2 family protein [Pseudomonadota bacterium]
MAFEGFSQRWKDFPDYIIGITKEIWEDRGTETLNRYYGETIPVRTPMGVAVGNQATIASTMATVHEFPDRELFAEDVIWSGNAETGYLSSHRLLTRATHTQDGQFGKATGKSWVARVIADCAAKNDTIYDEWLVRDYGGIVRQMGMNPRDFAEALVEREGGAAKASPAFTPAQDVDGGYHGTGNDNEWGIQYEAILNRLMSKDFNTVFRDYDRAAIGEYAGAKTAISHQDIIGFWVGLRSSFPDAEFKIHHRIGMDADMLSPRAAIRWSLDGMHSGWGAFGEPSGAEIHVMGMSHAEFGPWGLRREFALYDEIAIWKQILMHVGT